MDIVSHRVGDVEIVFGQTDHEFCFRGVRKFEVLSRRQRSGKSSRDSDPLFEQEEESRRDKAKTASHIFLVCVGSEKESFKI
jgi:hypothetical protein